MGFIHGLAVVLIIFERTIIQCKGMAPEDTNLQIWNQAVESDFEKIINPTGTTMSEILRDRIIVIAPHRFDGETYEYCEDGDIFLRFGSYRGLVSLFNQFGDQVKKIEIVYLRTDNHALRTQINRNIINRYAKNFEELRIVTFCDEEVWEEMSNGGTDINFPEVKNFQFFGESSRNELKLNQTFPRLESFLLSGNVADVNCLANITTLKELKLNTRSIQEHQLHHIFANNKNMVRFSLAAPMREETMHAIAKDLTKLQTLEVKFPDRNFLFRSNNGEKYELSSVTHFHIQFSDRNQLIGDPSFDMPHLKRLTLRGESSDIGIIKFINYFKELETVELLVRQYSGIVECIANWKHIKELVAYNFDNSELDSLQKVFKRFDKESKLQTIKLWLGKHDSYQTYERAMERINVQLAKSNQPKWTLSHGKQTGTDLKFLLFKRER